MWNPGVTLSRFYCSLYDDVIMTSWTRLVARHPRIPILGLLILVVVVLGFEPYYGFMLRFKASFLAVYKP